jgi:hypothetical protein
MSNAGCGVSDSCSRLHLLDFFGWPPPAFGIRHFSGLSSLKQYRMPERGARIAGREERA